MVKSFYLIHQPLLSLKHAGIPQKVLILSRSLQLFTAKKHKKGPEAYVTEYIEKLMTLDNKVAIVISFESFICSLIGKNEVWSSISGRVTGN